MDPVLTGVKSLIQPISQLCQNQVEQPSTDFQQRVTHCCAILGAPRTPSAQLQSSRPSPGRELRAL